MNTPDNIDIFLRESLMDWALEDIHHPIKRSTLVALSKPNWLSSLYQHETIIQHIKDSQKNEELKKETTKETSCFPQKPEVFIEEEWIQTLLKNIHYALKKQYAHHFEVTKWAMRRINTTGMYVCGPVNAYGEIFFKFKLGVKQHTVYWDLENYHGKIRPKGFEGVPRVILGVLESLGHDLLIRKISKGFGVMLRSGAQSNVLLKCLLTLKNNHIAIGNDAHGTMWIQEGKKKKFRLLPVLEPAPGWQILDKVSGEILASFSTNEEIDVCIAQLQLPKTVSRKA